ncbi:thioredoxin family protein [Porticoccaceae bacterium LTM1]|nr:thioredoxin family protein [Porticoccaceae bacterium LTM1]
MKYLIAILCLPLILAACDGSSRENETSKTMAHTAQMSAGDASHDHSVKETGIRFFHGSFDEALEKAKVENKLVFIDAYTTWCGPCRMMALNIFPLKEVGDFYNANFINLKLDTENEDQNGPELSERYGVEVLPTYFYLDPNGKVLHKATGFIEADRFIATAKEAMGEENTLFAELDKRYQAGERSPEFIREFLAEAIHIEPGDRMSQERRNHQARMQKIFNDYIRKKDKSSLVNAEDFALMKSFLHHAGRNNEYVDYVANHYKAFTKVIPESQVAFFLLESVKHSVGEISRKGDANYIKYIQELDDLLAPAYECQLKVIKNVYIYREYLEKLGRRCYLEAIQDWEEMLADAEKSIAEKGNTLTGEDYSGFSNGFGSCNDTEVLKKVMTYAKKGYELSPSAHTSMNYIGILTTLGHREKAIEVAEKTLASIDKKSKDANYIDILNQMLTVLKAQK